MYNQDFEQQKEFASLDDFTTGYKNVNFFKSGAELIENPVKIKVGFEEKRESRVRKPCLLYTSDAADDGES
ncbi:MAG: hypothetical protein IAE91_03790, partial [Ignavibacteriaceae bacterium]|nr:hypothetical protein [Ignavibacteriaceae bacterium]